MDANIPLYLFPEGQHHHPPTPWKNVTVEFVKQKFRLSDRHLHSEGPPTFNLATSERELDGFRSARCVVAKISAVAGKALGIEAGYYPLKETIDTVRLMTKNTQP